MKPTREEAWREISPYLDAVLDLAPEARPAWLDDLGSRRPDIARRLRDYLVELAELDDKNFLTVSAASLFTQTRLAGRRFGAYTLERAIGHGGMGSVWLANRNDGRFEGQAAVKLLNTALVGHPAERRFVREGSVLAKLRHPNIAHLLDAGVAPDAQPYLVLEYIRGQPIDRYCDRRQLGVRERITLFLDVLAAVAHAHSNLIVHRDLKPSNILVTEDGTVKLLDFGVAALLAQAEEGGSPTTTQSGSGHTPGYAAPEQLLGEPVTTATDVYALGVLLFQLLAGCHPTPIEGKSPGEMLRIVLNTEPPLPSRVARNPEHARLLRGDLDNIIMLALRRHPTERYGTAEQLALDLRRYLALEPVSAQPPSWGHLAMLFARRHRAAVVAAATVLIVLVGAVMLTTHEMLDARYQRDQARYQSRRAETSIDFLAQLMRTDNGPTGPVRTFHERLESGVAMLKQQYRDDPQFSGRMLVDLGDYYRNDEETERANQLYAQAYELGKQSHDTALMVSAQCSRAYGDAYAGIRKGTAERIQEGERLLTGMNNPDVTLEVTCLAAEAVLDQRLGRDAAADALLKRAMRIQEDVDGTTQTLAYASLLGDFGNLYFARNQPQEALRVSRLIQDIHERNGRGGTAAGLIARFNVATALTAMGEFRAALGEREIINQRLAQNGGPANDSVAYPIGYAVALTRMAQPERALQALDGVIDRARRGGNPGWLIQALLRTGEALAQLQRWDEADAVLSEAASMAAGEASYASAEALAQSLCAQVDLARGEAEEARHHRDASLRLAGYHTAKEQPALARTLLIASQISLAEGDREAAERFVRDALAISERVARGLNTSADVGEGLLRLAQVRIAAGDRSDARTMLERAIQCLTNGLAATHPLTREAQALLDRTLHS